MWVSSLEINNIKSFEHSGTIKLDKKMNILLGANNSGKSTILRVLYLIQNIQSLSLPDVRVGTPTASCLIQLEEIHTNQTIATMVKGGLLSRIEVTGDRGNSGQLAVSMVTDNNSRRNSVNIAATEPYNFIYPYLSKRKVQGYRREVHRNFGLQVSDTLFDLVAKVDRLANPNYPKYNEFEQACIDILGFPMTTFQAEDNNGKQIGLIVNEYDSIPLEAMGEGVPNLLGLIVNLCMANHKLFLIEELENDIHPRALKSLLELIIKKAEHNQFVISTHSNIVAKYLGSIPGSKIHYISSVPYTSEQRVPTAIYKEVGNTPQERREVLEDLGYDLLDYDLAKGWLFFEESSAERLIREFFIPWFTPDLKDKVNTIAVGGTSDVEPKFADFNRLFLFLHLENMYKDHAWVMVDGDPSGQKVIVNLKQKYLSGGWTDDKFINFAKHNFEEYYPDRFKEDALAALDIKDKQGKREAKKLLLDNVLAWIASYQEQARLEFEESAAEVIAILRRIETEL